MANALSSCHAKKLEDFQPDHYPRSTPDLAPPPWLVAQHRPLDGWCRHVLTLPAVQVLGFVRIAPGAQPLMRLRLRRGFAHMRWPFVSTIVTGQCRELSNKMAPKR